MRDIKFRAWDNMLNEYFAWEDSVKFNNYHDLIEDNYDRAVVLEQYTGLKDKNGVEIYEGDILKSVNGNQYVVIYIDGRFEPVCWYTEDSFEVIGNIHENADLLEVGNDI